MKRMMMLLTLVAFAITSTAEIYEAFSSIGYTVWANSAGGPWYPTISASQTSANNPTPWQKLEGEWVQAGGFARPGNTVWFRHQFIVPGSGPEYKTSKALIWIAFDKSSAGDYIDLKIYTPSDDISFPTITKDDTLHCKNYAYSAVVDGDIDGNYTIQVVSSGDIVHKINFYTMVNKNQVYDHDLCFNEPGYYLISLPMRFDDGTTLQSLFPPIIAAWTWNPFTSAWDGISTTSALEGPLGELVRSKSILILIYEGCTPTVSGYFVGRQRYLDLRCDSWSSPLFPIGSVANDVQFNWMPPYYQPDDLYDRLVGYTYLYESGIGYYLDAPPYGDYIITRFEGHHSILDNSQTTEIDNNGHLDLYGPFVRSYTTNTTMTDTPILTTGILVHEDTTSPILYSVSPSGYDADGLPLPPMMPHIDLDKISKNNVPDEFKIIVSPNPFNAVTSITMDIPQKHKGEYADMQIFDQGGRLVFETRQSPDNLTVHFSWNGITTNGNEAPSGNYLYKISVGTITKTGNICLIR